MCRVIYRPEICSQHQATPCWLLNQVIHTHKYNENEPSVNKILLFEGVQSNCVNIFIYLFNMNHQRIDIYDYNPPSLCNQHLCLLTIQVTVAYEHDYFSLYKPILRKDQKFTYTYKYIYMLKYSIFSMCKNVGRDTICDPNIHVQTFQHVLVQLIYYSRCITCSYFLLLLARANCDFIRPPTD